MLSCLLAPCKPQPKSSQTRLLSFSWMVQGSQESVVVQTTAALVTQKQQNLRGMWLALGCSVLEGGDSLGRKQCSKGDWPTDPVATWTNWYTCPLPSCPRTSKAFDEGIAAVSSPRHSEREFEILTAEAGLRAFEGDGAERSGKQSRLRSDANGVHSLGGLPLPSQHPVLAMQENLHSLFEWSTVWILQMRYGFDFLFFFVTSNAHKTGQQRGLRIA